MKTKESFSWLTVQAWYFIQALSVDDLNVNELISDIVCLKSTGPYSFEMRKYNKFVHVIEHYKSANINTLPCVLYYAEHNSTLQSHSFACYDIQKGLFLRPDSKLNTWLLQKYPVIIHK